MMLQLALWGEPLPCPLPVNREGETTNTAGRIPANLVRELRELNRRCGPVSAAHLSGFIGKSPRMTQYYLCRLAAAGAVQRVGVRGGWMVANPAPNPSPLHREENQPERTRQTVSLHLTP